MSRPASNGITGKPSGIKKRKADDELRSEQRLAKRFDLLNLEQTGKLYLPVQHPPPAAPPPARRPPAHTNDGITDNTTTTTTDPMTLDDTKHTLYIPNLDAELADTSPDERERLVFLPDIEKKLARIPQSVLLGEGEGQRPGAGAGGNNEMVLYGVPASLSVPEERDQVRKAIIESRARARERLLGGAGAVGCGDGDWGGEEGEGKGEGEGGGGAAADQQVAGGVEEDEDAMDLG